MADILSELRWKLKQLLHICKTDQDPDSGWNTTTVPLSNWTMSGELLADTLKRGVVEAEKRGLGDRAEAVFLRLLAPIADPVPAVEEASRFLERLDATPIPSPTAAPEDQDLDDGGPTVVVEDQSGISNVQLNGVPIEHPAARLLFRAERIWRTKPVVDQANRIIDLMNEGDEGGQLESAIGRLNAMVFVGTPEEWTKTVRREMPRNLTQLQELMAEADESVEFIQSKNYTPYEIYRLLLVKLRDIPPKARIEGGFLKLCEPETYIVGPPPQEVLDAVGTHGPPIEERIEKLRAVREHLSQWPPSDETIALAIGIWVGYPLHYYGSTRKEDAHATESILAYVNGAHEQATWLLMRLAEQHGIDPGPLYKASVVCRQLYAFCPMREVPGKTPPIWPDILGPRRDELPQGQREAIDQGELVFQRLRIALAASRQRAAGGSVDDLAATQSQDTAHGQPSKTVGRATAVDAGGSPGVSDVFLAHNGKDKLAVRRLKKKLLQNGLSVWLDEDRLRPGLPWQELMEEGIKASKAGAVIVGKDGLGPWENCEMRALLLRAVEGGIPVIPVLLPGAAAKPQLPLFLTEHTWVDLRGGLRKYGIDRLIWGISNKRPQS